MQLAAKGLTNYWGYSSIGYLAPHTLYAATGRLGEQVKEFKGMVKALHGAGIEVILDVVYNHTAEGNHLGPMLSFKGVDNLSYYRTVPGDPRHYMDYTGTGNSLNPVHPSVLRLIMDSLRYFVIEGHVDGFRFDLASALAREFHEVDRLSAFFDIIHQDPILSQVKLIAEPWDVGEGGYQVGNFPVLWTEWNGIYRDTMRDFWRGQAPVSEFASRFTGSSDLYQHDGRRPFASINFITAHDGFTLRDLVTYNEKHNQANLEDNRDGDNHNRSWNHGVEGETDDQAINALRERQVRNFLATLLLSQGVPMLLARRRDRAHAARQQQRLLPGQRDLLGRLAARRSRAAAARMDEAADRPAHAASGLPPRRLPHRRGAARLGGARRLVVPGGRSQDDAAELARRQRAHARRLPQRLRDPDPDRARRAGDRRHVPDPLQRLGGCGRLHSAGGLVRAPLGARALEHSPRGRGGLGDVPGARGRARGGPLADLAPPGRLVVSLRATYRLQLGPSLGFRRSPRARSRISPSSASRTSICRPRSRRGTGSTHGYDVVDPTRVSENLGGEDELRALSSAARDAGLGVVLDIVPNHMAATDENPFWRDPLWRAKFFDLDWRTGVHRRFFDVGELAGVRMEDPEVWEVTHQKVVGLAQDGVIDGVRVDHPDGLANPRRYLERLREAGIERVWVEKILEPGERLRPEWPVEGTTGYEFLNDVTALFVDPAAEEPLTRLYEELTGERRSFARGCGRGEGGAGGDDVRRGGGTTRGEAPFRRRRRARARRHPRLPHLRRAGHRSW